MDEKRFDELTTSMSNANSRRGVLRGVAAGGLASGLAVFGLSQNAAEAKKRKHHKKRCKVSQNTILNLPLASGGGSGALGDVCSLVNLCGTGLACNNGKCAKCVKNCGTGCCVAGVCLQVAGLDLPVCVL